MTSWPFPHHRHLRSPPPTTHLAHPMSRFRSRKSDMEIAAVVATHNRADLLAERALASVAGQSRRPDFLIVVDDSDEDKRPRYLPLKSPSMPKHPVNTIA